MKRIFKTIDKMITQIPVSDIMVKKIIALKEEDSVSKAIDLLSEYSISGVIVKNKEGKPVGMLSEGDILKKVFHKNRDPKTVRLKEVMHTPLQTFHQNKSLGEAAVFMKKNSISKLPIEDKGQIVGYLTKSDLLEKLNEIYYQNRQFIWLTVLVAVQFIVIAVLITALISKG